MVSPKKEIRAQAVSKKKFPCKLKIPLPPKQNVRLVWVQLQIILFHPATYLGHSANNTINS